MLRIGRIAYANCTPVFSALREQHPESAYTYISGVPAYLNQLLVSSKIDICPSSSIIYATYAEQLLIIPDISISSRGPVRSVLLFSLKPIEELDRATILLSSESATSINLLKILLSERYHCHCDYAVAKLKHPGDLGGAAAMLLIGDAALRALKTNHGLFVYDLGELWYEWTGEPFVFALWLTTKSAFKLLREELRMLGRHLFDAKRYAGEHLERIAETSPENEWMDVEELCSYWRNNICFDLGERHLAGLRRYYRLAAELRLIATAPKLEFLPLV